MNNGAFKLIIVVHIRVLFRKLLPKRLLILPLLSLNPLLRIWLHVQLHWELTVVVYLQPPHGVVVELEPPEHDNQRVGEDLDALPPQGGHLGVTMIALVRVVLLKYLTLNEALKAL